MSDYRYLEKKGEVTRYGYLVRDTTLEKMVASTREVDPDKTWIEQFEGARIVKRYKLKDLQENKSQRDTT